MKNLLVIASFMLLSTEAFSLERCPEIIRIASLKEIAQKKIGDTFQWKGESWTLYHSSSDWQTFATHGGVIAVTLENSSLVSKNNKEYLLCRYAIHAESIVPWTHKGSVWLETLIED